MLISVLTIKSFQVHLIIKNVTYNLCEDIFKSEREPKKSHRLLPFRDNHY